MRKSKAFHGARRMVVAGLMAPGTMLVALTILLLGAPFWLVNWVAGRFAGLLRRFQPNAVPWQELVSFEPEMGWKPRPNLAVHAKHDVIFHLTTDGEGWRGSGSSLDEADLVVVGDSFAFGTGVDDRDFFAERASVPIKAVGGPGYSMVHGFLWMERLGDRLRGKPVVWLVYYGNDLYENLRPNLGPYRMPFVRQRNTVSGTGTWEIVTSHVRKEPWPMDERRRYLDRLAELCTSGFLAERAFSAARYLVERAAKTCHMAGAGLVVVGIPDPTQLTAHGVEELTRRLPKPAILDPEAPDRALSAICKQAGVPFVPLRRYLSRADYKLDDCHWTPEGHSRVAWLLEEIHRAHRRPVGTSGSDHPLQSTGT